MSKKLCLLIFTTIIFLLLSACKGDPTPTPFPTTAASNSAAEPTPAVVTESPLETLPTAVPATDIPPTPQPTQTAVPTTPIDIMTHQADPLLINKTWEWVRRDPNGTQMDETIVPNPESYTLIFNEDGTFHAQLDCNSSNGRYATEPANNIFMELGPTTLAFCGENSLDTPMTLLFGPAQSYQFEENGSILALIWVANGPIDYFQDAAAAPIHPDLINKTWQWTQLTSSILDIEVENPEKYLIQFNEDGSANLQADCNLVDASYIATSTTMTIELGASTLAVCPDGALYELYLLGLNITSHYLLDNDTLVLEFGGNDGLMLFTEASTETSQSPSENEPDENEASQPVAPTASEAVGLVNAPDGINLREGPGTEYPAIGIVPDGELLPIIGRSEDRQWWVVTYPDASEEPAWVSANFIQASNANTVPVTAAPEIEPTLTDNPWQWLSLTTPLETTTVADPILYTIQFLVDGSAAIRADCNNASASYTTNENNINIDLGATTLVACPGDSLDAVYLNTLTGVSTYFFEAGDLYLELPADGGTMRFAPDKPAAPEPSETSEPTVETPAGETDGQQFIVTSFGGAGTEEPVLTGTQLTLILTETEITGSAGCNAYSGTVTQTEDTFTISSLIVTQKACSEPEGIMAQEQAFLTALESTGGFSWEERLADDGSKTIIAGQLFYVASGINGIINVITP